MIFKKQRYQPDKKVRPFIGVLLFLISVVLIVITGPLGLVYGFLHSLFSKKLRGIGEFSLQLAISIDQLGNVLMQHLLNALWLKKDGYPFGNRDETISSALGRNRQLGTLTPFGLAVDGFLDFIDPGHSLNSIDYYIEPGPAIIDRLAWILIRDNKVLFLREKGVPGYFLPGGSRDAKIPVGSRLKDILYQLLGIQGLEPTVTYLGTYEGRYPEGQPAAFLRQHLYTMDYEGSLAPGAGLEGIFWIAYPERERLIEADRHILQALKQKGLLH